MADRDDNDDQKPVLQAAKDSPVADAVAPEPLLVAAKWLPDLGWIGATTNSLVKKPQDFGGGRRAKGAQLSGGRFLNPVVPAHVSALRR